MSTAKTAHRASLGVALISRNASETIGRCLDSIRPFVQQIVIGLDATTTDNTKKIARKHGVDVIAPIQVSDWHECAYHGRVLAQDFAAARNASFKLLDPSLDFWMWLDSDDIVKNPELLAQVCANVQASDGIGAWLRYDYATMGDGKVTNTRFHRERILRTHAPDGSRIEWEWQHRVHEVVAPKVAYQPKWAMLEDPAVVHQEKGHDSTASAKRNLTLLEIDLEENPDDIRAIFYMGNQYFAMGDMRAAVDWYERLGAVGKNPYELWQAWCYASIAYERLGDLDNATKAAFCAIDVEPRHPEPYYRLASIYLLNGQFDKCEYWTAQASHTAPIAPKTLPPFFVFKNPLDYTFNSKMPLADALAAQGKIRQARTVLEEAYAAYEDERVGKAIEHYKEMEDAEDQANSFLRLAHERDDAATIDLWEKLDLPPKVKQFGRVRNCVMPAYLKRRTGSPRVIFYCGRSLEEWSPETLNTTGIGGSETAVIEIAKRFAADGWQVDVYNGAGRYEGEYATVGYWDPERLRPGTKADLVVNWRQPAAMLDLNSPKAILWLHDLNYGPAVDQAMKAWGQTEGATVCGVSAWHARMLERYYDLKHVDYVPNGIDLTRFQPETMPRRNAFQCVYASSPDRGLLRLLQLWPKVLEREPGATLKVAYGWDGVDKAIQNGRTDLASLKQATIDRLKQLESSVEWLGRLPQDKLAELYLSSAVWTYPTSFLEVSCISSMEAMAGGAVPVTSAVGALPETIGDAGLLVPGQPETHAWQEMWLEVLMGTLTTPQMRWPLMAKGAQRASQMSWDAAYEKWKAIVSGEKVEEKEAELVGTV